MNYPTRPQSANAWQIAGQALGQGGQILGQFGQAQNEESDRRTKLAMLAEEMAQKRTAAQMARIKAEREAQLELEKEARAASSAEFAKGEIISPTLANNPSLAQSSKPMFSGGPTQSEVDGLTLQGDQLPNQSVGGNNPTALMGAALDRMVGSGSVGRVPRTRDEIIQNLVENRQFDDLGKYANATDPARSLEGKTQLLNVKNEALTARDKARQDHQNAIEDFKQGRIDRRQLATARAAENRAAKAESLNPRGFGGLKKEGLGDTETKSIKDIRRTASLLNRIDAAADNISNLKRGPITGRASGINPYDADIAQLEKLVKQTVPSLARGVFGEVGVLTDEDVKRYQDMFATIKTDPTVARRLMDDLKKTIEDSWYITLDTYDKSNKNIAGFDPYWDFKTISQMKEDTPRPKATPNSKKMTADDYLREAGL
jgi:hypothetical protein